MPMPLSFEYEPSLGDYVAWHNGYRITAKHDDDASNPFEDWDGNWPILVYYDGSSKGYDKAPGPSISNVLERFTDEALVHNQVHIAKALDWTIHDVLQCYGYGGHGDPVKYIHDAEELRDVFANALGDVSASKQLEYLDQLYAILDIPHLLATSTGYCQGDWAEVLVVATPEAQKEFGCTEPVTAEDLRGTVNLYSAWAWGDVYGYVIEKPIVDEDGEVEDWEEVDSCWGYYGSDFDESGLAEAALDAVPDEPAVPVREREDA